MHEKIVIISLLASLIAPVFSQDLKKNERTCRLVFPEKPSDSPKFIYLYDGKDNHRLYLSAVNFSDVVELKLGDINLVMAPEPVDDPENIPLGYPKLFISEKIKNFYIFLSADKKNIKLPLKMQVIDLDSGKFNLGNTLWCNLTNHRIIAKLGNNTM